MQRPDDEDDRRLRRAWILEHHPDRGGDPEEFMAGLARFATDGAAEAPPPPTAFRPTVYRSRTPWRRAVRIVRTVRQVVTNQPRSRKLL